MYGHGVQGVGSRDSGSTLVGKVGRGVTPRPRTHTDCILIIKATSVTLSPGTSVNLPKSWIETVNAWAQDNLSIQTRHSEDDSRQLSLASSCRCLKDSHLPTFWA